MACPTCPRCGGSGMDGRSMCPRCRMSGLAKGHTGADGCAVCAAGAYEKRMVTFQGASDDLVEIDGCPGADEFEVLGTKGVGYFHLHSAEGDLLVRVAYEGRSGCWSVGFAPLDEDVPVPPWPLRWEAPINGYTACIEVECPADTTLTRRFDRG